MLNIRRASHDDAQEICMLHKASIRQLCGAVYLPEQIVAWTEPLTPDRYLPAMREFEFFVAEEDRVVGFVILNLTAAELNAIYLPPDPEGRGVGRRLFEFAEGLARDNALAELKLKSTLNAVGFYEACGFQRVRESIHANSAGVELPCVEMSKALTLK
jgi:GNAT superfamily N-acetyltransferase